MKSNLNRLKLSHLQNPTLLGQRPTLGGLGSGEFETSSFILIFIAVGDHVAAGDVDAGFGHVGGGSRLALRDFLLIFVDGADLALGDFLLIVDGADLALGDFLLLVDGADLALGDFLLLVDVDDLRLDDIARTGLALGDILGFDVR